MNVTMPQGRGDCGFFETTAIYTSFRAGVHISVSVSQPPRHSNSSDMSRHSCCLTCAQPQPRQEFDSVDLRRLPHGASMAAETPDLRSARVSRVSGALSWRLASARAAAVQMNRIHTSSVARKPASPRRKSSRPYLLHPISSCAPLPSSLHLFTYPHTQSAYVHLIPARRSPPTAIMTAASSGSSIKC